MSDSEAEQEWEAMKKLSRADEEARLQREAEENARVQQVLQVNTCQTGNDSTEKEGGISCIFGCQSSLHCLLKLASLPASLRWHLRPCSIVNS